MKVVWPCLSAEGQVSRRCRGGGEVCIENDILYTMIRRYEYIFSKMRLHGRLCAGFVCCLLNMIAELC